MALLRTQDLDAVVSIGTHDQGGKYKTLATGFLIGFIAGPVDDKGQQPHKIFLVTTRHVFENKKKVTLRFNLNEKGTRTYELLLEQDDKREWLTHKNPKIDTAVVGINFNALINDGIKCEFLPESRFAYIEIIKTQGIAQGDGVFVLGFPMGLAGSDQNYVIVRGGIISRLDSEIIEKDGAFLIDSTVFPGNSGGPVILKPDLAHLSGTKAVNQAYILGVVSKYIQFSDVAVSQQTQEPRIVFMENSGLSHVVPLDFVRQCVEPLLVNHEQQRLDALKETSQK